MSNNNRTIKFQRQKGGRSLAQRASAMLPAAAIVVLTFVTALDVIVPPASADYVTGRVMARNLVLGPNGQPIFAEFGADGNVIRQIGEAVGLYQDAIVVSADSYRHYIEAYQSITSNTNNPDTVGSRIISREAYQYYVQNTLNPDAMPAPVMFLTASGARVNANVLPQLHSSTKSVVVRAASAILTPDTNPILLESPIDLNNISNVANSHKSVIISAGGSYIQSSENNIGFRTAFLKPKGTDATAANECISTYGIERDNDWTRNPQTDDPCGPVGGAILSTYDWYKGTVYARSDNTGDYELRFSGSCSTNWITSELNYTNFNPKSSQGIGRYFSQHPHYANCYPTYSFVPILGPLQTGFVNHNISRIDPKVDVIIFSGTGEITNQGTNQFGLTTATFGLIPLSTTNTLYNSELPSFIKKAGDDLDLDNNGQPDPTRIADFNGDGKNEVGIYLNGRQPDQTDSSGNLIAPDLIRQLDTDQDFKDRGLLKQISRADMLDTDLYVFRLSSDQLITEHKGLGDNSDFRAQDHGLLDSPDAKFFYKSTLRGPVSSSTYFGDFEQWQTRAKMNLELSTRDADHLRIGERVKIIAINRRTGYIGSVVTQVGNAATNTGEAVMLNAGRISFHIDTIIMRPPNLKIKVERQYDVQAGIGKDTSAGTDRKHIIGFEGAGLKSDDYIAITTQWFDHDDSPLPSTLPGYTGRLAKIVSDKTLGEDGIANFEIKPGTQLQVVQLPSSGVAIGRDHYYIHVNGKPVEDSPNFSKTGEGGTANQGILQYRPKHYVPFKVPLYDEVETSRLRAAGTYGTQGIQDLPAFYQWPYRPEMQFSVFELDMKHINRTDADGQVIDILTAGTESDPFTVPGLASGDQLATLVYDLQANTNAILDPFGYADIVGGDSTNTTGRDLIFALGADEAIASFGIDQTVTFTNLNDLGSLMIDDYLAISLYQNTDSANVLWEFVLPYVDIAVDLNRDGKVEFTREQFTNTEIVAGESPTDRTTPTLPYRFWINNDLDVVNNLGEQQFDYIECGNLNPTFDANTEYQQVCEQWDENPATSTNITTVAYNRDDIDASNARMSRIESLRDLEDFAPLAIRVANLDFAQQRYSIRIAAHGVGINLFAGTWRDDANYVAHRYMHDASETKWQVSAANGQYGHVLTLKDGTTAILSFTQIQRYFKRDGIGRFIFEGIQASQSTCSTDASECYVSVAMYDNARNIALSEQKVYLDLHDVRDFYLQATAGSADTDPGLPNSEKAPFNANYTGADIVPQAPSNLMDIYRGLNSPDDLNRDFTLLVHGWRMRQEEIIGFTQTSYKRLYWSGYKGKFGGLSWPTGWFDLPAHEYGYASKLTKLITNLENYDVSETSARRVGAKFAEWLQGIRSTFGNIHLIAHSMGNVVASEALRAHAQQYPGDSLITSYTAAEAAEVAGAYDHTINPIQHAFPLRENLPPWLLSGCIVGGGDPNVIPLLGPESSWRCYNNDNDGDYDMPPDLYRFDYSEQVAGQWQIRHGATTDTALLAENGHAYYADNNNASNRIVSFYSSSDAALNVWEMNQLTKPDNLTFEGTIWKYNNLIKNKAICAVAPASSDCDVELNLLPVPQDGIVNSIFKLNSTTLQWGPTIAQDNHTAEILANIIPARTRAMGQGEMSIVANQPLGFTNSNQDHSAQFHGYYAEPSPVSERGPVRANFWNKVLTQSLGLIPDSTVNDFSGLRNDLTITIGQQP